MLLQQTTANITTSLIILILGLVAGRIVSNILSNLFKDLDVDRYLDISILRYISTLSLYLIYALAVFFALRQIGISFAFMQIFGIIALGILVVIAFLSFKDSLPNITAYFYVKRKYRNGKRLSYENFEGKIVNVNFFETRIRTNKKEILAIPNIKLVLKRS